MTEIPNHPVYSRNVLEMITVANEFCMFMAKVEKYKSDEVFNYLQKISPLLYLKGALIPEIEASNPEANEKFVTSEEYELLFNELRKMFAKDDEFWFVDDLDREDNDPIKGSLAEHYADLYQDLMDFILLYQKNSLQSKENAVAEIKRLYNIRWGYRILTAQKALHKLVINPVINDDTVSDFL
jgi:hypothetical protein